LMAMVILSYLPVLAIHHTQWSSFAAANGQCMVWKRSAYEQLGGHSAVKANVLEDVALARMVKSAGMRLRMADANHFIYCRMYKSWPQVRDGYAKNILAGYGGRISLLLLATLFHWLLFIFPWFWLTTAILKTDDHQLMAATALIVLGITIRGVSAVYTHQRAGDALFMPLSVLLMTRIALQAIWWHYKQGGPSWKGRKLHTASTSRSTNEYL
jgi:chlorobactene glucosyltransferase